MWIEKVRFYKGLCPLGSPVGNVGAIHESPVLNVDKRGKVFFKGLLPLGIPVRKGKLFMRRYDDAEKDY